MARAVCPPPVAVFSKSFTLQWLLLVFGSQVVPIPHVSAAAKTNRYSYVFENILSFLSSPSCWRSRGDLKDRSSSSSKSH